MTDSHSHSLVTNMSPKLPQGTVTATTSLYGDSGRSNPTQFMTTTTTTPRRLFNNLRRMSTQSLASIQSVLPEYSETSSIRSYRPESTSSGASFITPSNSSNSNRDSVASCLPPRYSVAFGIPLNVYEFKIRANKPWATLKVFALGPENRAKVPHLSCKDLVTGVVELQLESSQMIKKITLSVIGRLVAGSFEEGRSTFLDHSVVIWAKENGDPRNTIGSAEKTKKFEGKLQGFYELPFSFPFPTPQKDGSTTSSKVGEADIPFPPTFQERGVNVSVEYEFMLRITQGRFKPDARIKAPFKYILAICPPPMSERRRVAYEMNALAPGPLADPDGWVKLAPARVKGQMLPSEHIPAKSVSMVCTLCLATPLAYTRGSMVSCYLTLQSEDENALDILSTPKSPYIRLIRRLTYFSPYTELEIQAVKNGSTGYVDEIVKECAAATWWVPPKDVPQERTVRRLEGEIHLPEKLHPSCSSNILMTEYSVELLPPVAFGFEPFSGTSSLTPTIGQRGNVSKSDPRMEVLLSHPIDIVTLHAAGDPVPIPFTEPRRRGDETANRQSDFNYSEEE